MSKIVCLNGDILPDPLEPAADVVEVLEKYLQQARDGYLRGIAFGVIDADGRVFFISQKGFYSLGSDGSLTPIGRERVDRTFFSEYDSAGMVTARVMAVDVLGSAAPEARFHVVTRDTAATLPASGHAVTVSAMYPTTTTMIT